MLLFFLFSVPAAPRSRACLTKFPRVRGHATVISCRRLEEGHLDSLAHLFSFSEAAKQRLPQWIGGCKARFFFPPASRLPLFQNGAVARATWLKTLKRFVCELLFFFLFVGQVDVGKDRLSKQCPVVRGGAWGRGGGGAAIIFNGSA